MFDHQLYLQTSFYLFFFCLFTIELIELLVAKSYYSIGLLVAKSSNMLLVTKSWTVEQSVAKDHVRHCLHITMASLATAGSVAITFSN
jgi:hypothetical protein